MSVDTQDAKTKETHVDATPAEGRITDEAVANAQAMVGLILRPEGPYLQDATCDTMRNFCNGIGDLNPLYREEGYGRNTRFGSQIGHPMFPMAYGWLGRTRWGLPGVHGFYVGNDWEIFRHVRPSDRLTAIERIVGVEEKHSEFSGRLVMQFVEGTFLNQRDEIVARVLGTCTRHERRSARKKRKYKPLEPHDYTAEELEAIDKAVLNEVKNIRGNKIRYWEDVKEGETLTDVVRGPLSMMDTMGFLAGCARGDTHGLVLGAAKKHPGHYFRNKESGGGVEYTGIGHHRKSIAKRVGVPGVYDYGPQRSAWMATLVTNWMGDSAVLKRVKTELHRFNTMGDTTFCKGKITRTYVKDGYPLVDIDIWAENQRGETTVKNGIATVILPSRDTETKLVIDGSGIDLKQ